MKIRSIAVAAVAIAATSLVYAEAAPKPAQPEAAPRGQTLVEELAAGMREILRAVAPEIALPKLDIPLPSLDTRVR